MVDDKEFYAQTTCPHCNTYVGIRGLDVHEVLMHPEKRERFHTQEYRNWLAEQAKSKKKKK